MSFPPFVVSSLRNVLGVPSTKFPIDGTIFVSYVLPPLVCQFFVAVLAVIPQTRLLRVASWPLVASLALRAALSVDMSLGNPEQEFNNTSFVLLMVAVASRTLDWTLEKGPFVRHLRPANISPSNLMDALDLLSNFRGIGWEWSGYQSYTPRDTRPTNRVTFVFYTAISAIAHALICGASHRAILTLLFVEVGSISKGTTIFDDTLPFFARCFRASIISIFAVFMIYPVMQMAYDLGSIFGILIFGQDPVQWPPAFDAPWRATSLNEFWSRRWHQFYRHIFLLGGRPLSVVFGRPGMVVGAFLASALWHHISLITLKGQVEIWWMPLGFGMMIPGILIERAFNQLTGRRVGGFVGWAWTMAWLLLWGTVIVEGFARGGMFNCSSSLDSASPFRGLVERLMVDFDAWLHTI